MKNSPQTLHHQLRVRAEKEKKLITKLLKIKILMGIIKI